MHIFIDTNILLDFFHFTNEQLDSLNKVFASHEHGAATVHLTGQVKDEFRRNREAKINDALKRFKETKFTARLPSFMQAYDEYCDVTRLVSELQAKSKAILEKVHDDIARQELMADKLIKDIFDKFKLIQTSDKIYDAASRRISVGNPPGKNKSIGDAINWLILLETVPNPYFS